MQVFETVPSLGYPTAVALGLFDGIHLGHQRVIEQALAAKANGLTPVVLSFDTGKMRPKKKQNLRLLTSSSTKKYLLERMGVPLLVYPDFAALCRIEPLDFIEDILFQKLCAKELVCGQDYRFGKHAAGDVQMLSDVSKRAGVRLSVLPTLMHGERPISSSRIREALAQGDLQTVNGLLGHPFIVDGVVVSGQRLAGIIGFPTINQVFESEYAIPKYGVYSSTVEVQGRDYRAVTNIGMKPTINYKGRPIAETHILGFQGNLYGQKLQVRLLSFVRPEQKFATVSLLQQAIQKDIAQIRKSGG